MALPHEPCTHVSTQSQIFSVFQKCVKETGDKPCIDIEISCSTLWPHGDLSWCSTGHMLIWVGGLSSTYIAHTPILAPQKCRMRVLVPIHLPHCTPLWISYLEYFSLVTRDSTVGIRYFPHGVPQWCCFPLSYSQGVQPWFFFWGISLSRVWFLK